MVAFEKNFVLSKVYWLIYQNVNSLEQTPQQVKYNRASCQELIPEDRKNLVQNRVYGVSRYYYKKNEEKSS